MLNTRHANLLLSRPASLQKETKFCGFGREREMLLLKSLLARSGRPPVLTKIPRSRPHIRGSPLHWRAERLTETCGWLCANGKWLGSLLTLAYLSMRRRGHFATTDSTPAFGHPDTPHVYRSSFNTAHLIIKRGRGVPGEPAPYAKGRGYLLSNLKLKHAVSPHQRAVT